MATMAADETLAGIATGLSGYFARDPSLRARYRRVRRVAFGIAGSNYDISRTCNLKCEGCLFFEGTDYLDHADDRSEADWEALFAAEAARGVNFAYLAGGEPALEPRRLAAAARHIRRGVVFTNGTVRIDPALPFVLHVSLWGGVEDTVRLRGGSSYDKAFRNFGNDPRARFVYTVNAQNIDGVWGAAERCASLGTRLSFSLFSPTEQYRGKLANHAAQDDGYFRISSADSNLVMDAGTLIRVREELDAVRAAFPATVLYTRAYNHWVTDPAGLYRIDPATGWAIDCETRRASHHHHIRTDLSTAQSKCCSPNIDCRDCRAYSMAAGTAVSRFRRFATTYDGFRDWLDIAEQWAALFLLDEGVSSGLTPSAERVPA